MSSKFQRLLQQIVVGMSRRCVLYQVLSTQSKQLVITIIIVIILIIIITFITLDINNYEVFTKNNATQCKEAGMAISGPPG